MFFFCTIVSILGFIAKIKNPNFICSCVFVDPRWITGLPNCMREAQRWMMMMMIMMMMSRRRKRRNGFKIGRKVI
ncbi:hypothetical protein Hanom_Chr07g00643851 [Helianthus anomalus]